MDAEPERPPERPIEELLAQLAALDRQVLAELIACRQDVDRLAARLEAIEAHRLPWRRAVLARARPASRPPTPLPPSTPTA